MTVCQGFDENKQVIRGHTGTLKFTPDGFDVIPQGLKGRPGPPLSGASKERGEHFSSDFKTAGDAETRAMWENFLECVRSRNPETFCPTALGQAAVVAVNMGVQSYREGKALFFDKEKGAVTPADPSWVARWEERSRLRGKPNQVIGWHAGDTGSGLYPHEYQKLEGDWVDGEDPAPKT